MMKDIHIGLILDGNRRWARERDLKPWKGHYQGFEKLKKGNYDSVIPVAAFSHPIQRALFTDKEGIVQIKDQDSFYQNTQDLPTYYHDTGQFYWFNSNVCMIKKELLTDNSTSIILPHDQYQDVDNKEDWELMHLKYQKRLL